MADVDELVRHEGVHFITSAGIVLHRRIARVETVDHAVVGRDVDQLMAVLHGVAEIRVQIVHRERQRIAADRSRRTNKGRRRVHDVAKHAFNGLALPEDAVELLLFLGAIAPNVFELIGVQDRLLVGIERTEAERDADVVDLVVGHDDAAAIPVRRVHLQGRAP